MKKSKICNSSQISARRNSDASLVTKKSPSIGRYPFRTVKSINKRTQINKLMLKKQIENIVTDSAH